MASVLILGAGGRENALAWKISQSQQVGQVYVYPGNAVIKSKSHNDIIEWCKSIDIKLVVIGPEDFLADGFSDALSKSGIPCFGPSASAAQIESSKAFSKALMTKYGIPTAEWKAFTDAKEACNFIINAQFPALVVKASGLAAGKGVIVAKDKVEACIAVTDMLESKVFGDAGSTIIVEELLEGEEVSCMAFCDGKNFVSMPTSQDHKRLLEGDNGPNTGGMGAYCPVSKVTTSMMKEIEETILKRTMRVMEEEGCPFIGVLYAGLMLTASGPKVLEFNCRFGDPETQALMVLLKSDLYEIMQQCVTGILDQSFVQFEMDKFALGIVLASEGYPGTIKKNVPISNLEVIEKESNIAVFHSGTAFNENKQLVTSGGRVMTVVATSDSLESALCDAKKAAEIIHFEGKQFRRDIGWRSLTQKVSLTYKDSGVDIEEGDVFVTKLKPLASSTNRSGVMGCVGSFGAMFDLAKTGYKDPLLVSGTDGVGTKLKIAQMTGRHNTIGIDLVAMCINDILCHGAEPLLFLDYFSCGKLKSNMAIPIIEGISEGCKMAGCALVGGETAEMPGMYNSEEYDLAGFAVGVVERSLLLPSTENSLLEGDFVIAISSSGFHSNGYSLVRKVLEFNGISLDEKCPFDDTKTVGDCVLTPTRIYVKCLLPLMKKGNIIKAAAHITGGGLPGNVERVVPDNLVVRLDALNWNIPPVFTWIQALGNISEEEMLKTFNCGVGMVVFVDPANVELTLEELKSSGFESSCIGQVCQRNANQSAVVIKNFGQSLKKSLNFEIKSRTVKKQKKVAVLISGSGTNLQSLIDSSRKPDSPYCIGLVISNVASAYGLQRAKMAGIPTLVVNHKDFKKRVEFDAEVHKHLLEHNIELVCLAGFMRIISDEFVANWHGKMLNIHPSLLPSFKGLHVHKSVLEAGCLISGCSVHFVSNELDGGAILAQESVPVLPGDTEDDLCERVKTVEHIAYPRALRLLASGKVSLGKDGKVMWA